jgi:hypothetical protein
MGDATSRVQRMDRAVCGPSSTHAEDRDRRTPIKGKKCAANEAQSSATSIATEVDSMCLVPEGKEQDRLSADIPLPRKLQLIEVFVQTAPHGLATTD